MFEVGTGLYVAVCLFYCLIVVLLLFLQGSCYARNLRCTSLSRKSRNPSRCVTWNTIQEKQVCCAPDLERPRIAFHDTAAPLTKLTLIISFAFCFSCSILSKGAASKLNHVPQKSAQHSAVHHKTRTQKS